MKTIFFEVQEWEREKLQYTFPEALLVDTKLTSENVKTDTFQNVEIVSTFISSTINKEVIDNLPNLKMIATRSTGYDHIDVNYAKTKNIFIANVPEYGSNTVAEHTFALILSLTRKIYQSVNQSKSLNFNHDQIRGTDLYGKTIGIIGLGKIGINVLRIAKGFGMNVLVYSRSQNTELQKQYSFQYVDLEELLRHSDIVTFHLPLTPKTKHIIHKQNVLLCKKNSYLINTARGALIETEAIILGLDKGVFAGVGLDVLEEENKLNEEAVILTSQYKNEIDMKTLIYDHILINHPKVLITPHNAFNSVEALGRIMQTTIENIQGYLQGHPQNLVSLP